MSKNEFLFSSFKASGNSYIDTTFEFPEQPNAPKTISLRTIIRQFLGSPQTKGIPSTRLFMILGRFRSLLLSVTEYNKGVSNPTPLFQNYWRHRTLNLLSGFGFQVSDTKQWILIPDLAELVESLEIIHKQEIETAKELIKNNSVTFDALFELYKPSASLQSKSSLGAVYSVVECYYEERRSLVGMEKSFNWTMEFVVTMGQHFTLVHFTEVLSGWTGVRARQLSGLDYAPVEAKNVELLIERGRKYVEFANDGCKYVAYGPNSFFIHSSQSPAAQQSLSKSNSSQLSGSGRVMIDAMRGSILGHHASNGIDEPTLAITQAAGRYKRWLNTESSGGSQDAFLVWDNVPSEMFLFCWPAIVGFSYSAKVWGHVLISGLSSIEFRNDAFDRLVLAEERKQLIRALVRFGGEDDGDDIIGGKRGGSIFLLHGPPGVGKTLTAEAIAEVLHRPLYYVTMGELGTNPADMERRLSDILDLCAGWNALTLFDEADVFLEQRTTSDLVRNAMVCVMLRLLEYHPGILFLTTNRVQKFDPAFESRVTVALRYESLTTEARSTIWKNLLARISRVDPAISYKDLGKHELNGRQIKNAVRLAVSLAREKQSDVNQSILETTLRITSLGRQEMKGDQSWKE